MSKFPFDIVLFDLDGTLVDSNLDLGPAINHALSLEGRDPVPPEETQHLIGGGGMKMLERALERTGGIVSPERFDFLVEKLLEHYWAHIADNTVPYGGCIAALDDLRARGCRLAVCTNKSEGPARQLLDALDMTRLFDAIYGGDTLGRDRAKPVPDMLLAAAADCGGGRFAMVGDSSYDTRAAKAAGCPVVFVSFGYNDIPEDQIERHATIDHYSQLAEALEKL